MLTARRGHGQILGLDYGADDYITKPFNILELAESRPFPETEQFRHEEVISFKNMEINLANRSVLIDGKDVNLTAKEFDLLQLFATNPGKVYSRENLLEIVWKYDYLEICGQLTFISAAYGKR